MPLHPVVGRPAEVQAAGASLAAHQATRELPTAGPWAKFAASAKKEEDGEVAAAAAKAPAPAIIVSEQQQQEQPSSSANGAASSAPAVLVQGLDFSYPDIGKGEELNELKESQRAIEHSQSRFSSSERESVAETSKGKRGALSASTFFSLTHLFSFLSLFFNNNKNNTDGRPLPGVPPVVVDMNLSLPAGSRCLLLGANGAGKTTLLKVLGGKHLVPRGAVSVLGGRSPFHDTALASSGALSYLGGNWERDVAFAGFSVPLAADFGAGEMLARASAPGPEGAARREKLIEVLDIDPEWRMHRVSDGQRRRVQIAMGEFFFWWSGESFFFPALVSFYSERVSAVVRGLFLSLPVSKKKKKKTKKKTHFFPFFLSLLKKKKHDQNPTQQACSSPLTCSSSTRSQSTSTSSGVRI